MGLRSSPGCVDHGHISENDWLRLGSRGIRPQHRREQKDTGIEFGNHFAACSSYIRDVPAKRGSRGRCDEILPSPVFAGDSEFFMPHKWIGYPGAKTIDSALDKLIQEAENANRTTK